MGSCGSREKRGYAKILPKPTEKEKKGSGGSREKCGYACDFCKNTDEMPPVVIASIQPFQSWFFCSQECWRLWLSGAPIPMVAIGPGA
jgi:hypothetical protein